MQHETAERIAYGGSYMEEVDWWNKPYKTSRLNEFKYMVPEILFLRGLWKENRSLWWLSFPFHLGLYLMMATFVLLLFHAFFALGGFAALVVGVLLSGLIVATGWTGLIAGSDRQSGHILQRLTDRELRAYSSFADYFNILFIFLFYLFALMTCLPAILYWKAPKPIFSVF